MLNMPVFQNQKNYINAVSVNLTLHAQSSQLTHGYAYVRGICGTYTKP